MQKITGHSAAITAITLNAEILETPAMNGLTIIMQFKMRLKNRSRPTAIWYRCTMKTRLQKNSGCTSTAISKAPFKTIALPPHIPTPPIPTSIPPINGTQPYGQENYT